MNIAKPFSPNIALKKSPNAIIHVIIFLCMILLLNIYPLANTIAARNILLVSGAILSLYLLFKIKKVVSKRIFIPFFFLLLVITWSIFHYLTIPTLPDTQLHELKSTWLRASLAIIFGLGAGISLARQKNLKVVYSITILGLPAAYITAFIVQWINQKSIPIDPYYGFFMTKSSATYFLIWPMLFYCGLFISSVGFAKKILLLAVILLTAINFVGLHSLSGILICFLTITSLLLLTICTGNVTKNTGLKILFFVSTLIISFSAIYSYGKIDYKIYNIYTDAVIGWEIDNNIYWQGPDSPLLPEGRRVNQSTFYRVASFKNGLRIIAEHPLGAGFTYLPYGYYMKSRYPNSTADHTHSGWVDFTLGVGIPGLLLTWFAIFFTIFTALKIKKPVSPIDDWNYIWSRTVVTTLAGMFLVWLILEVSEKEYIEHTFFMISFLAASLIKPSVMQTSKVL